MNETLEYQISDVFTSTTSDSRPNLGINFTEVKNGMNETNVKNKSRFPSRLIQLIRTLRKLCQDKIKSDHAYNSGKINKIFYK